MQSDGHGDTFGCSRGFIKKGSIGDVHFCQLSDHGLIVEQHFEAALCDLSLVRGVGRVPLWVLQHIPLDDGWDDRRIVSLALIRRVSFIHGC